MFVPNSTVSEIKNLLADLLAEFEISTNDDNVRNQIRWTTKYIVELIGDEKDDSFEEGKEYARREI